MSVDRQQMLETAERLNQQMADGIPYTWETLEQALSFVTEKRDRGIHGRICYFAAFYHLETGNQEQCLKYLDESVRCLLGTDQEIHVARVYNMIGIVACVAVVALGILYFLKLAPAREKAAKERLESGQ